jgi:hypothetical protein
VKKLEKLIGFQMLQGDRKMNKENTEKLFKDFPGLYRDHDKSARETRMCDGFACSDGWFDLIYELSKKITEICPKIKATQVKEKFGTLAFYVGMVQADKWPLVCKVVNEATEKSAEICEECGETKTVKCKNSNGSHYIRTLCAECRRKDEEERKNRGF